MVNVTVVVPLRGMNAAPKDLEMVGGATTEIVAVLLVLPGPPSFEVTAPVVLFHVPAVAPVTVRLITQGEPLATVALERETTPVAATVVSVPPHCAEELSVMVRPAGRVSEKLTPVSGPVEFGFVIVKLRLVVVPSGMLAAPKALLMVGGPTTVTLAVAVFPVPALAEVIWTLLFFTPPVVPCTVTVTVQAGPGARLAPDKATLDEPFAAVTVAPEHVELGFPGVATTKPAGRLSVNASPVIVRLVLVVLMVNVRLVVPFSESVAAPKAFAMAGGLITVRVAVAAVAAGPASDDCSVTLLL
jgi:hypothetical protein